MEFPKINRLTANSTYHELKLRTKEYLKYNNTGDEQEYLAEDVFYNSMVSFLEDLGMERKQAEKYCDNRDNLTELAQYISSILG